MESETKLYTRQKLEEIPIFKECGPVLPIIVEKILDKYITNGNYDTEESFYLNLTNDEYLRAEVKELITELMQEYIPQSEPTIIDEDTTRLSLNQQQALELLEIVKSELITGELDIDDLYNKLDTDVKYLIGTKYNVLTVAEYGLISAILKHRNFNKLTN